MALRVVPGGSLPDDVARVASEVRGAFDSGDVLCMVAPGTDAIAVEDEIAQLGGVPEGAGVLMRTSGSTTGTGKIVALPWTALTASASATHETLGGAGTWLTALPVHHIAGFQTIYRSVLAGTEPVRPDLSTSASIRAALTERTYLSLVPTQLQRALRDPAVVDALREVSAILVGGASISPELLDAARTAGLNVVTTYGMTETGGGCVYDGRPIGGTEITVEDGRIVISGDVVALGYVGGVDPEAFPAANPGEPGPRTFRTQDAGTFADGRLAVLGRIDDAITTGGMTVMPRLIEDAIGAGCVVVGIPDDEWGQAVVAVLDQPASDGELTGRALTDSVRAKVRSALGAPYAPKHVVTLAELGTQAWPATSSGKIDRRTLAELVRTHLN